MKKAFSKIAGSVAVVALALTIVAAPTASALTAADIQLLVSMGVIPADKAAAALAALGGGETTTASCGTYTRDLTLGSTGADVVSLQSFLEAKGQLVIPTGVSKGYFGVLTQTALGKYQASVGISPTAGYFGPITRAKVSSDCSVTTPTDPSNPTTGLSGDEASLEKFDFSSGDDSDVEEDESADVAEIEFDVEYGDIMLDRIDLQFTGHGSTDPWDALESVELVLDGDVIGEADLSDEDDYLDEDDGIVRINKINTKIDEGDTATIIVRVTAQDRVRNTDLGTFSVNIVDDGIRATDALGIQQYIGDDSDVVTFDVVIAGDGEELNVSSSKENPEESTLKVEDSKKSDAHAIFAFELEAEEGDIEIDSVTVEVTTASSTSGTVADYILEIDGEEFDDWSYTSGVSASSTRLVTFDIDGDFTLDADDEVTVVLFAEFNAANGSNYSVGNTISAKIAANGAIEGEGAEDVTSEGTATGKTHTLATEGIEIVKSGFSDEGSTSNNDGNTSRDYTFTFDVTAFEEDFYVNVNATSGVTIFVDGPTGATTTHTYTVDSTGDEEVAGIFSVERGETETFTVVVSVSGVSTTGQYRVGLASVKYTENSDGVTGIETKTVNQTDFRTAYRTINQ